MGEQADAMMSGQDCAGGCGIVFERPHGYPVLCGECWADEEEAGPGGAEYVRASIPVHPMMREDPAAGEGVEHG